LAALSRSPVTTVGELNRRSGGTPPRPPRQLSGPSFSPKYRPDHPIARSSLATATTWPREDVRHGAEPSRAAPKRVILPTAARGFPVDWGPGFGRHSDGHDHDDFSSAVGNSVVRLRKGGSNKDSTTRCTGGISGAESDCCFRGRIQQRPAVEWQGAAGGRSRGRQPLVEDGRPVLLYTLARQLHRSSTSIALQGWRHDVNVRQRWAASISS